MGSFGGPDVTRGPPTEDLPFSPHVDWGLDFEKACAIIYYLITCHISIVIIAVTVNFGGGTAALVLLMVQGGYRKDPRRRPLNNESFY